MAFGQDLLAATAVNYTPRYAIEVENLLAAMARHATGLQFQGQLAQAGYQPPAPDYLRQDPPGAYGQAGAYGQYGQTTAAGGYGQYGQTQPDAGYGQYGQAQPDTGYSQYGQAGDAGGYGQADPYTAQGQPGQSGAASTYDPYGQGFRVTRLRSGRAGLVLTATPPHRARPRRPMAATVTGTARPATAAATPPRRPRTTRTPTPRRARPGPGRPMPLRSRWVWPCWSAARAAAS